jgi:hypothetical protein
MTILGIIIGSVICALGALSMVLDVIERERRRRD